MPPKKMPPPKKVPPKKMLAKKVATPKRKGTPVAKKVKKVPPKKKQHASEVESETYETEALSEAESDQVLDTDQDTPRRGSSTAARRLNFTHAQNNEEEEQLQSAAEPEGFVSDEDEDNEMVSEDGLGVPLVSSTQKLAPTRQSKQSRANIFFPVTRIKNQLKGTMPGLRIGETAAVYTAAVLDYMCSEVLELSGEVTIRRNKVRITPRDIMMTIKNDEELSKLTENVTFPSTGVPPHIERVLIPAVTIARKIKAAEKKEANKKAAASNAKENQAGPSGVQKQPAKRKGEPTKEQGGKKIKQTTSRPIMSDSSEEE